MIFYIAYQKWFAWIVLLAMAMLPWFSLLLSLPAMILTKLQIIVPEEVIALTGNGIETWGIHAPWTLERCLNDLLCAPFAPEGSVNNRNIAAAWQFTVGGEPDEA